MTSVEVCPICDIAGCKYIRERAQAPQSSDYRRGLEDAAKIAAKHAKYTRVAIVKATASQIMDNLVSVTQTKTANAIEDEIRAIIATPSDPVREAETAAARDVLAERARQISVEGWTPEHDDAHVNGELRIVAAAYADRSHGLRVDGLPPYWPRTWAKHWWKPIGINDLTPSRFDLVKAGALILAEIERLDRQAVSSRALADGGV